MVWQRKYIFVDSKRTTTMKTAIKLAFIYLAMQILGALAVGPFTMIYAYVKYGTIDRICFGSYFVGRICFYADLFVAKRLSDER